MRWDSRVMKTTTKAACEMRPALGPARREFRPDRLDCQYLLMASPSNEGEPITSSEPAKNLLIF
jgi:hypothetical protein